MHTPTGLSRPLVKHLISGLFWLSLIPANAAELKVNIVNIKPDAGKLMLQMVSSEAAFAGKDNTSFASLILPITGAESNFSFDAIPPGEYAISVFQDVNTNQKLDSNMLGIPKEPYGFSNDARGKFGPAKWQDAKFTIGNTDAQLLIHLSK